MAEPNYSDRRREPRYEISNLQSITAHINRKTADHKEKIDGQLLDLSRSGAKVSASVCLQFAEEITLQISVAQLDLQIDLEAKVCWIRPSDSLQWLIGCSFSPPLSDESISQLANCGIIERRQHTRQPVCIAATAKWQLEEETFPVEIRDYSSGGFCIVGPRSAQVDQGVQIFIPKSDTETYKVSGRVRWQMEQDGTYVVGCTYSGSQDFEQLNEAAGKVLESQQKEELAPPKHLHGRRSWPQLAATILLVIGSASVAASIPYWMTSQPPDGDVASLDENASLRDSDSHPPVTPTSHKELRNDSPSALARRSSVPPLTHDGTAGDKQPQPRKTSDGVASSKGAPTPSDRAATRITPSPPRHTTDLPTPPAQEGIRTASTPTSGAEGGRIDSRALTDFISGLGERLREHADIPVTEDPVAQPTDSPPDNNAAEAEQVARTPTDAEVFQAREAFARGTQFYRRGDYRKATDQFQLAANNDPQEALYFYLLAMSQFQTNALEQAEQNIEIAIALEKDEPIANWGSMLSRYQGKPRLWVERRRSAALTSVGG
jgi:tetratricopeptide (TPR) repeat protein